MAEHNGHSDYIAPEVPLDLGGIRGRAFLAGLIGLVVWGVCGFINMSAYGSGEHGGTRDFFLTWQIGFVYWMSIPIGAMALSCLGYITTASWGLVFRRIFQAAMRTMPFLLLFFIPVVISLFMKEESPFWWVIPADQVEWAKDNPFVVHEQSHRQSMYLNTTRFIATAVVVFGAYLWTMSCLVRWGLKSEDERDRPSWVKLRNLGGPAFIFWALSFTVLITDYVMSVEPAWASTMFGVIAGMNCFLCTFCFSALMIYTLVGGNPQVMQIIKPKFRIDIGTLIFGFCMIWTYATFSQYMLIWAGNMPEEITYYKKRLEGGWEWAAYALMLIHWFLPFVILLFRPMKTHPVRMQWITIGLLTICALDVIWWILPAYPHPGWAHFPMAVGAIVGIGGLFTWAFLGQLAKRNILPKKDTEFLATWGEHH